MQNKKNVRHLATFMPSKTYIDTWFANTDSVKKKVVKSFCC